MTAISVTAAQVALVHPQRAKVFNFVAAETITAGAALYITSAGKVGLCDTDASGKQQFRGIALNAGGAGSAISVLKEGAVKGFDLSGVDYDALAYAQDDAGVIGDAVGTLTVNVGRVMPLTDPDLTKVLYVKADWLRAWA